VSASKRACVRALSVYVRVGKRHTLYPVSVSFFLGSEPGKIEDPGKTNGSEVCGRYYGKIYGSRTKLVDLIVLKLSTLSPSYEIVQVIVLKSNTVRRGFRREGSFTKIIHTIFTDIGE